MQLTLYADPKEFYEHALPCLLTHEVENHLVLGLGAALAQDRFRYSTSDPVVGIACADGSPGGVVLMTPPRSLLLTRMAPEVAASVAEALADAEIALPGVMGPQDTAAHFTAAWSARTAQRAELAKTLRIYQLDRVLPIPAVPGRCVQATMDDYDLLCDWIPAFWASVGEPGAAVEDFVRRCIADRTTYLWKTDAPVSLAAIAGPTPNGIRVGQVYTPPEHRNHGYATVNVAAISQRMLDAGRRFCFLYANLANPTSNSIYQKIGYQPVCDVACYNFT